MTSDSEKESDSETYNNFERIYKNDPLVAKSHVNKKVSIKTQDSKDLSGYVYCQDPVSERSVMWIYNLCVQLYLLTWYISALWS